MPVTLRLRELESVGSRLVRTASQLAAAEWAVQLSNETIESTIRLHDPFTDSSRFGLAPESNIKWYLEKYATEEPFERTRAELAQELIVAYGHDFARQIASSSLVPKTGDLEIEVNFSLGTPELAGENGNRGLRRLLWEVLENVELWPTGYNLNSVSIIRSVQYAKTLKSSSAPSAQPSGKRFNILLVVSRPGRKGNSRDDIDYQLVSRCLVAIIDHVSKTNPDVMVSLKLLRPPTWMAFREHLRMHEAGYYDLVHMDMHGEIVQSPTTPPIVKLAFCKPSLLDPLKMSGDYKSGAEVAKVLAQAGIQTVVLNACESASFRMATKDTNLAEILLSHGIRSVVAMAYKVVDEAIEIFMNVFYQSLLVKKLSVQNAVRVARLALLRNPERRARYMHRVQLLDFVVPVLYKLDISTDVASKLISPNADNATIIDFGRLLASIKRILPSRRQIEDSLLPVSQQLIGRAQDILSLEILLSACRLILLHGQGGCGKSQLLRYACGWWKASGWFKEFAFIDLAEARRCDSLQKILEDIDTQLHLRVKEISRDELIARFQNGSYLLVLDNTDCLDMPILAKELKPQSLSGDLRHFVDAACQGSSTIIISSRKDTTSIAKIPSSRQKYQLPGISVLDSMDWLQKLAFPKEIAVPESFQQGGNQDALQRIAILLEGNPAALIQVAPALKRANYDAEELLKTLLYGVCKTDRHIDECRFVQTIYKALFSETLTDFEESFISLDQLSIFWTLMPADLTCYYWFLYLPGSKYFQEATYANWISKEFQDTVHKEFMALKLRKYWPGIVDKLLSAGILEKCAIKRADKTEFSAYHVHPIFTLLGRQFLNELGLKQSKYGYVRQILLWDYPLSERIETAMIIAEWGEIESHEDYTHNVNAIAMAFSLEDGNLVEEVARMGASLLDVVYNLAIPTLYINQRQPTLLVPLLRQHLLRVHMVIELLRPNGIPTSRDLDAVITYSWALFRLEKDENQRAALVRAGLEAVERWRAMNADKSALTPPLEFTWFQLRHAETDVAGSRNSIYKIKSLLERNLADQPMCPPNTDMYNAIRRWQLQNLTAWASVVWQIAMKEGTIDESELTRGINRFANEFEPGTMPSFLLSTLEENTGALKTMTIREQYAWAIKQESDAVSRFCPLIQSMLDMPLYKIFSDYPEIGNVDKLLGLLKLTVEDDNPRFREARSMFTKLEAGMHMLSGNTATAASILSDDMQREARSSDTSSGWQNLAELHMHMYGLAVMQSNDPDYRKGITHLDEWWKLHNGVGISKQEICYAQLKYATCYDGLKMSGEAGRAVLRAMELFPMTEADLTYRMDQAEVEERIKSLNSKFTLDAVIEFRGWLLRGFAALKTLDVFLDPQVIFSGPTSLSWQERATLVKIMKEAKALRDAEEQLEKTMDESLELRKKLEDFINKADVMLGQPSSGDRKLEGVEKERERERRGMLAAREKRKAGGSKLWL